MFKTLHNYSALQVSYFIFFALLPFVYSESFIDPVLIPRQAFLTLFLSFIWGFVLLSGKLKNRTIQISTLSLLLIFSSAGLVILSFISNACSTVVSESIYVASKYGILFLFLITTYVLLRAGLIAKSDLTNGVLAFCILSLLYGICDVALMAMNGIDILKHAVLINATYANKNLFASVLVLCCWAVLSAKLHTAFRYALIIALITMTLLIQSKIATAVVICMFLLYAAKNLKAFFKTNRMLMITGVLSALIIVLFVSFNFSRFQNLSNLHTLDTRYSLWRNSFEMVKEYPLGVGSGNWQVFFPKYGLSHFDVPEVRNGLTIYHQPHNDFIWVLCELGIQGLVLYLSGFILTVIMLFRTMKKGNSQLRFLLLINILGYCAIAFFDFPLERIEHQVLLSVTVILTMNNYDVVSARHKTIRTSIVNPIAAIIIGFSMLVCFYRLKGEYYTRQFILADRKKQADFVISACSKAQSPFYSIDPVAVPIDWYAGVSLFSQQKTAAATARLEKARQCAPWNIHVLVHLGTVYEMQGEYAKAAECYYTANRISPDAAIAPLK